MMLLFKIVWIIVHVALFAYFNHLLDKERRARELRELERLARLEALGFHPHRSRPRDFGW